MASPRTRESRKRTAAVFLVGLVIGVLAMGLLAVRALPVHREHVRIESAVEQDFLAARAAREGNELAELVHRWNGVAMRDPDGGPWATVGRLFWQDLAFTFAAPILESMARAMDPDGRGHRLDEALHRSTISPASPNEATFQRSRS